MQHPQSSPAKTFAGALLVFGAIGFVVVFSVLASTFGYPDVLDRPAAEVLPALIAGGGTLEAWWVVYAILPLCLTASALLARPHLARLGPSANLFTAAGVGAGVAMAIGLLRWSTLQQSLGESWLSDPAARAAIEAMSDASNRMLGNALGEVVGETLLGIWLLGVGLSLWRERGLVRGVALLTSSLAALMIVGAWRFTLPAFAAVTEVTNLLLPLGLITLGVTWMRARLALPSAVATAVLSASSGHAAPPAEREVILHGFRSPSMGVEVKQDWIGFHVGVYPTIIDEGLDGDGRTTWFAKTGLTFYPFQFDTGAGRPSGFYAGMALMQGLGNAWDTSKSATTGGATFFDLGFRWAAFAGFDLRLGAGLLVGFDGRTEFNFTPGFSWAVPY